MWLEAPRAVRVDRNRWRPVGSVHGLLLPGQDSRRGHHLLRGWCVWCYHSGIFISKLDDFVSMLNFSGVELARYGWGLYVFGAGFVVLALASFVACFAAPVNPPVGYIVGTSSPTVVVAQSSSNTNMSNTYQPYPPASYPPSAYPPASYPPSTYPPSAYPPSAYPPSAYPPSAYPPSAYPPNTCSPNPVSDSSSICTSEMPPGGYSTSGKVLD
ncbi:vegetative cell wall protein gp1-like isoform X4 [Pomacea canaliculata]|uniref:vegetative cell wall protein gp1-like isoform X4 n=1 Tax=Pomacea canaliculata TaxID=400727 RepID=UPI000D734D18|nr:vegetative cell wall protein gp1-like isoform X4 [Pomacea canaliculata]